MEPKRISPGKKGRWLAFGILLPVLILSLGESAFAQGSIFGTVQNADLNNPPVGDLFWVGFLDNTDEEIRIESNVGAGYDGTNWFDDFQNYTTEAAGNPYDYYFVNVVNGQAYHLAGLIPSNSFQQQNILLAVATVPTRPTGLVARVAAGPRINLSWNAQPGVTHHVYRRNTSNNGVFRRIDNPAGSLANPGVADSFFVDATSDGVSDYTYLIIGEDASGDYSAHSVGVSVLASSIIAPAVTAVDPDSGSSIGLPPVTVYGTNFDVAGVTVTFGGIPATNVVVISPFELTCNVPPGLPGAVDVVVTNTASALASAPLVGGFRYLANAAPVLASIGARGIDEGQNLNFGISAADVDADSLILTAESVPTNATFTDNYDGTGTFNFNPDFTQSGVYNVTFIASDGALADTEIVAITVNHVNLTPALATIGSKSVAEGTNLNFGVSGTDPDADSLILTAQSVPVNATFSDNYDGTGTFDFNPDFTQSGIHNVRFIVSDGALADTEIVAITVGETNLAPTLASIGARSVDEGQNLSFGVSGTDPDADSLILTAQNVPTNATFTDNYDGTGTFDFNPDFTQSGVYNVTFIVSDGALADTEIVAITVNHVNLTPALATIGSKSVAEGTNLNFGVSGTDPDADSLILTAQSVPVNATFTDNYDGTGTFDFNPDFTQSGIHNVRFIVSDGALADTEIVAITVGETNLAPTLASIGARSVDEGQNLSFGVSGTDPDADSLILSAENVPTNATFTDNYDGTGTFDFNPDYTQSGVFNVRFIVSDGALADTEVVAITVGDVNLAPTLAAIGSRSVGEGLNLNFGVSASDPDADSLILTAEGVPVNATFTDNYDGTGTFDFNPDYTQAGVYSVTFIVSDGALADTEIVAVTVSQISLTPTLTSIGAQSVDEGQNLNFGVSGTDPDGDSLILTAENVPVNATFTDNYDGSGTFDFNPDYTQSGVHNVTFIVSDGALADTEIVAITVNHVNLTPVLATIGARSVDENQTLNFGVSATDPDADSLILSAVNLPVNTSFVDNYDGTGAFSFSPDFVQAGIYDITFIASDGALADTEIVAITVNDINRPPILLTIGSKTIAEGQNLHFDIGGDDPDFDSLILTAESVPVNATFTDHYDGIGTFDFNPDFTQAGDYYVTFIVSDGALADTEIVAITVNHVNLAPVLTAIGSQVVNEGQNLNLPITASDFDLDSLILTAENLPANATFSDNYDGTGTFDFNPDYVQAGLYSVTFIVSDGVLADTEIVAITVNDAGNQAPVLAAIGPQIVTEGLNLNFGVSGSDPDGDSLILTAVDVPVNATFNDHYDGTGTLDFNPDFTQAGVHNVTIIVSDGALADTEIVAITVNDAGNQLPVLAVIGPQAVTEGQSLNVAVSATDPDLDSLILTAEGLPANAIFTDNYDGTGALDFNPDFTQAGVHNVTVIVSDGVLADTEIVAITVNDAGNQRPVLAAIGARTVDENQNLNVSVSATDADLDSLILTAEGLPANATFTDNYDGTGTFDFNPDFTQAGAYDVTFIVSDGALADTEIVAVTVNDINQAPVLAPIGSRIVAEGTNLNIAIAAADADGDSLILTAENLPPNATFADAYDGTGTFDFNPDFTQSGVYNVTFIASDGALADTEIVAVTVNETGNQRPVLAPILDTTILENTSLTIAVAGTDPDLDSLILTAENLPANAAFVDNFDGTGTFDFNPSYFQAGVYPITFIASDQLLADTAIVQITVNNVNQWPILDPVGPLSVSEGAVLQILVTASDADGVFPTLTAENLPAGAVFSDSANGTAGLYFAPLFNQQGVYQVLFIASDGADADSELVDLTVTDAGNQPPVLASIGPRVVVEGTTLAIRVTAADADSTTPVLTAINLPANATFVDSINGAGGFVFNPDFTQGGVAYEVTFIASDGVLADSEAVLITVTEVGNLPPVFDTVPPQTVAEGDTLVILVHAVDPEGTIVEMGTLVPIENGVFVDSGNGYGTLTYMPSYMQAGVDTVRVLAIDGNPSPATATLPIIITTTETNIAPYLTPIGGRTVLAGDSLRLRIVATDSTAPLGNEIYLSTLNAPLNSTFHDSGNGIGGFVFKPTFAQIGLFTMKFIATDNGVPALAAIETVTLAVQSQNRAPVLATIGTKSVYEGDTLIFVVTATDPDGTIPFLTAAPLPANATFVDARDGTGTLTFTPNYLQAGLFNVTFSANDGLLTDKETVLIQVRDAGNQPPVFDPYPASVNVLEWETLTLALRATDPESQALTLSVTPLLEHATFVDSGNGIGVYEITPDYWQDGTYDLEFLVEDTQGGADTANVTLIVNDAGNQAPFFLPIADQSVREDMTLQFTVTASDTDRTVPSLAARPLPANAAFVDNGNGTGTFSMDPDFTQDGVHDVYFIAIDEEDITLMDSVLVPITVLDFNWRPVWDSASTLGQQVIIAEGDSVTIWHAFSDPDGPVPVVSIENVPSPNMTWVDSGNGLIWIKFVTDFNDRGNYTVVISATDADYDTAVFNHSQLILVGATNLAPVIDTVLPQTVMEGQTLEFIVTATDPNGTTPTVAAFNLPANATFTPLGSGTGRFRFTPTLMQAGVYYPMFTAADYQYADTMRVQVTVSELGNQAPVWQSPFPPETDTVALTVFTDLAMHVWATDVDNLTLTLRAENVPFNAAFADSGNMAGLFTFSPDSSQLEAFFRVAFIAADTSRADTANVTYHVMSFMRGDWDSNGILDVLDVVNLIAHAFRSGPEPIPWEIGDINSDGKIDVLDVVRLVDHVFRGGPPPPP